MPKPAGKRLPAYWPTILLAAILLALPVGPINALAAEPGVYRVTGVVANDVLNVRSEPDAGAEIMGEFSSEASRIEILEVTGSGATEWGRVLAADANGWVAMRFLEPEEVPLIAGTLVPVDLQCSGTEPFWDVKAGVDALEFKAIDVEPISLPLTGTTTAIGRNNRFSLVASDGARRMTAMLASGETCSDGMSDRDFGWRIDLLIEGAGDGPRQYEGCCRLPPLN